MKENYEILLDCSPFETFEKSRQGLEDAIDRVDELLLDGTPSEQLQLVYVQQDATGEITEFYDVYEITPLDLRGYEDEMNESMDGDFDSAMTSAGLGTDEDYGSFANEDCGWFGYEGLCED